MIATKFIRPSKSFFALGFGIEKFNMCDDEKSYKDNYPHWHAKVFLGVWILLIDFNFRRK